MLKKITKSSIIKFAGEPNPEALLLLFLSERRTEPLWVEQPYKCLKRTA